MTTEPSPDQPAAPATTTTTTAQLPLGASWYPEVWPEDQWALDVARMKEVGVTVVRLFEYAWHRLEPREWEYDFDWANRVLNLLQENNLKAVIATPTAAPPAWLTSRYPEVLGTDYLGRRGHRIRHPYSPVSSRYREFCTRIVDQMVHSFRGHDAILAWQIDSGIDGLEWGGEARRLFHVWLHERFGHIDQLNKAWGTELWGQAYEYFEQVPTPRQGASHPSLKLAYHRFINDQWGAFVQAQCETIRAGFDKPITLNMPCGSGALNWFRLNHLVDRAGVTFDNAFQLPQALAYFDRLRGEKPGVSHYLLGAPTDQNAHALGWLSVLAGGDLALFDHWRVNWAGQEMGQGGIVTASGKWTPARRLIERLARECAAQGAWLESHPPVEARLAIVASHESVWAFAAEPTTDEDFDYRPVWYRDFYRPLAEHHYWRDVIDQTADFCPYHVIVMPLVPMVFRPTKDRLKQWVQEGGHLLLGPWTGHRTEELTAWTDQEFGGLEELMGAAWSHALAEDTPIRFSDDAHRTGRTRGRGYALTSTTAQVVASYEDGSVAALINQVGEGSVLTLAARVDEASYLHLVRMLCEKANVHPLATGSRHVAVLPAMNPDTSIAAYGLVNLSDAEQTVTLPEAGKDRLAGTDQSREITLGPRQVKLIELATAHASSAEATGRNFPATAPSE